MLIGSGGTFTNLGRMAVARRGLPVPDSIHGTRVTMTVVLISVFLGDTVGFLWGLTSGYLGNRFDLLSQRVLDVLMAFPALILAMLLLTGLGAGLHTVIVAIAVSRKNSQNTGAVNSTIDLKPLPAQVPTPTSRLAASMPSR